MPLPGEPAGLPVGVVLLATAVLLGVLLVRRLDDASRLPRYAVDVTVVVALLAVSLASVNTASAATILLPDLISDDPLPVGGAVEQVVLGQNRLLLKFDGYVTNVGDGPLEVSGNPQIIDSSDPAAIQQRALDSSGGWNVVTSPTVQFELADDHNHFHLMEIGRYSLWNSDKSAEAAPAQKIGFCLYDIQVAQGEDFSGTPDPQVYTGAVTLFCDTGNPASTNLRMGTGAGWRDIYGSGLTFQWIDVSNVAPGTYWLANEADPFNRIIEKNENNPIGYAKTSSTVPGYNALPVGPVAAAGPGSSNITLTTESFGTPGAVEYVILTPPAHGSLDEITGVAFSGATVSYTPTGGYNGCDSFEYVARDTLRRSFPTYPTRAVATINAGSGGCTGVEVDGLQSTMLTGSSETATATTVGAATTVTWSVDGVVGGNATVGTISSTGLYEAPDSAPAAGFVKVRATRDDNGSIFDDLTVTILSSNRKPNLVDPGAQTSTQDESVSFAFGVSEPDGDLFTTAAFGLPPGLSINAGTGVVTGAATTPGSYTVTFVATDSRGLGATVQVNWTVYGSVPVSTSQSFRHPWGIFDVATWTVNGVPVGTATTGTVSVTGINSEFGTFAAPAVVPVSGMVTVRADRAASSDFWEFDVRIPGPPIVQTPTYQADTVGDSVSLAVAADDRNGDAFTFTVSALPAGLQINSSTGVVSGTPSASGSHSVTVTATDTGGRSASVGFDWWMAALFTDVDPGSWYGPSVKWMAEERITNGTSLTTFSPDRDLTRAEAVTLLWRWMGEPAATSPLPFLDVDPDSFAAEAIAWAAEVGVVRGRSSTAFDPGGTMIRAELATIFHRMAGSPAPSAPLEFDDIELDRYFTIPVTWMAQTGLTTGITPSQFDPYGSLTRAQMGTVICRYSVSAASTAPGALAGSAKCAAG